MPAGRTPSTSDALRVENLRKVFQKRGAAPVAAVDGLTFSVPAGHIFGLLGPNGAGKTTTLKILTTLIRPTSGTAEVAGFDVVRDPLERPPEASSSWSRRAPPRSSSPSATTC